MTAGAGVVMHLRLGVDRLSVMPQLCKYTHPVMHRAEWCWKNAWDLVSVAYTSVTRCS